jgi:hypothetical protein
MQNTATAQVALLLRQTVPQHYKGDKPPGTLFNSLLRSSPNHYADQQRLAPAAAASASKHVITTLGTLPGPKDAAALRQATAAAAPATRKPALHAFSMPLIRLNLISQLLRHLAMPKSRHISSSIQCSHTCPHGSSSHPAQRLLSRSNSSRCSAPHPTRCSCATIGCACTGGIRRSQEPAVRPRGCCCCGAPVLLGEVVVGAQLQAGSSCKPWQDVGLQLLQQQ